MIRMRWTADLACGCTASGECGYPLHRDIDAGQPYQCTAHGETAIVRVQAVGR